MDLIVTDLPRGIPCNVQEIFGYLTGQMIILSDKWKLFHSLFCTSEEITELLRQSGESVFGLFYMGLKDDLTLSICKLADSPENKSQRNLVFKQLKKKLDATRHHDLIDKLDAHYDFIKTKVTVLKSWRDKHIAHLDYNTALQGSWEVLPYTSSDTFKEAILALEACWNEFFCYFTDEPPVFFTMGPFPNYDLTILILKLKKALAYDKLEKEGKIERRSWEKINIFVGRGIQNETI